MRKKRGILWFVNLAALMLFLVMLFTVLNDVWLIDVDAYVNRYMHQIRLVWLTPLVHLLTDMNGFVGAALFSAVVIAFFLGRRWYRETGFFLLTTLGATVLFAGVKYMVARARPEAAMIELGGYSFPSGHTTMATAMAFALYFTLSQKCSNGWFKSLLFFTALGWSVLIALTRLYLGVHWFTDVVGGFGLGLWWVTLIRLFWKEPDKIRV